MEIGIIIDEEYEPSIDADWMEKVIHRIMELAKAPENSEMGWVLTSGEEVGQLAGEYLKDCETHDVLTFAFNEGKPSTESFVLPADGLTHLGEVVVSYQQAAVQAEERHHPVRAEIVILTIHGILHLLGYDHADPQEETRMRGLEAEILKVVESEFV